MKKVFGLLSVIIMLSSCGSNQTPPKEVTMGGCQFITCSNVQGIQPPVHLPSCKLCAETRKIEREAFIKELTIALQKK